MNGCARLAGWAVGLLLAHAGVLFKVVTESGTKDVHRPPSPSALRSGLVERNSRISNVAFETNPQVLRVARLPRCGVRTRRLTFHAPEHVQVNSGRHVIPPQCRIDAVLRRIRLDVRPKLIKVLSVHCT